MGFSLAFTDEYGDEWTTRPIPMVVRLSQTLKTKVQTADTSLDFGNDPGIHKSEVSIGDIIRVGNSYRLVTKLEYRLDDNNVLDTSLQYYQKIHFTTQMGFAAGTAKAQQTAYGFRTAGTPVYRVTVAKEIREALKALPNDRITDVTVEAITRGGHVLDQLVTSSTTAHTTLTFAAALSARGLLVGDILRNGDEYRAVDSVTGNAVTIDKTMGTLTGAKIFKQNGMKYDITFEQGCRTHEDCRYNGVDENDSDGPAQKELSEALDSTTPEIVEGDHIRIENQVRTVVKSTANSAVLYVDRPFEEIDTSDITKIFPRYTPVEVIADMGGVRSSCTVTDLRQLTSTEEICRYAPGTDRDV